VVWDCTDDLDNNQLWYATEHGTSWVLHNVNSGYVVGVAGGSTQDAAAVVQWHWYGQSNACWWSPGV